MRTCTNDDGYNDWHGEGLLPVVRSHTPSFHTSCGKGGGCSKEASVGREFQCLKVRLCGECRKVGDGQRIFQLLDIFQLCHLPTLQSQTGLPNRDPPNSQVLRGNMMGIERLLFSWPSILEGWGYGSAECGGRGKPTNNQS